MAINGVDLITIEGDEITADLLVWRRYKRRAPYMFEAMLDMNPHLARHHRNGPFIPLGVQVAIPIDSGLLQGKPIPIDTVTVWGQAAGYRY